MVGQKIQRAYSISVWLGKAWKGHSCHNFKGNKSWIWYDIWMYLNNSWWFSQPSSVATKPLLHRPVPCLSPWHLPAFLQQPPIWDRPPQPQLVLGRHQQWLLRPQGLSLQPGAWLCTSAAPDAEALHASWLSWWVLRKPAVRNVRSHEFETGLDVGMGYTDTSKNSALSTNQKGRVEPVCNR